MPVVAANPLAPAMSFYGLVSLLRVFGTDRVGFRADSATRKDVCLQKIAMYFVEKMTAQYLVVLEPDVSVPDHGVEYLVKAFAAEPNCGAMAALTFCWPNGEPNLQVRTGKEKRGPYTWPIYGPMMDVVGRWAVQHQNEIKGLAAMVYPPHVIDVPCFSGGLFVVSREVLAAMDGCYFHERGGYHMHSFCQKVRQLGYTVKAAMHVICAGGGTNHINFLQNYGKPKED
ncbi:MAG: hypothetical protein AMS14_08820 [Planctomycetes bacterium DG_20]|nr:MAG: hypothetical protein AMS14_08820 [Planctomycetes bacterium DG_20]